MLAVVQVPWLMSSSSDSEQITFGSSDPNHWHRRARPFPMARALEACRQEQQQVCSAAAELRRRTEALQGRLHMLPPVQQQTVLRGSARAMAEAACDTGVSITIFSRMQLELHQAGQQDGAVEGDAAAAAPAAEPAADAQADAAPPAAEAAANDQVAAAAAEVAAPGEAVEAVAEAAAAAAAAAAAGAAARGASSSAAAAAGGSGTRRRQQPGVLSPEMERRLRPLPALGMNEEWPPHRAPAGRDARKAAAAAADDTSSGSSQRQMDSGRQGRVPPPVQTPPGRADGRDERQRSRSGDRGHQLGEQQRRQQHNRHPSPQRGPERGPEGNNMRRPGRPDVPRSLPEPGFYFRGLLAGEQGVYIDKTGKQIFWDQHRGCKDGHCPICDILAAWEHEMERRRGRRR